MNWFDEVEKLDTELKAKYSATIGKDDPEMDYFNAYAAGYFQAAFTTLLYRLDERDAVAELNKRISDCKTR